MNTSLMAAIRRFGLVLLLSSAAPGDAAVISSRTAAEFNAAAGSPPFSHRFREPVGATLQGNTIAGATFSSPPGNILEVVAGASTTTIAADFSGIINAATNKLFPTSGVNVLSPGGTVLVPGPQLGERDSLQIDFAMPVSAFGIDILFQSLDFASFVSFQLFGPTLASVLSGDIVDQGFGNGGAPGGDVFVGFVSNDPLTNIRRIIFTETDDNEVFPDANIGYDTLRFVVSSDVPEPAPLLLLASRSRGSGCAAAVQPPRVERFAG